MCFKRPVNIAYRLRYTLCGGLAFAVFLLGCSGQNDPYNNVPVVQLEGAACMDQIPAQVHDYFNGVATPNEARALWGCFHYALSTFEKYVQGPAPGEYDPKGLRRFLEVYFISHERRGPDGHVISDSLLAEIMEVKKLFIGGSTQMLTAQEISRTLVLIDHLQNISLELLPYARFLFTSMNATDVQKLPAGTVNKALAAFDNATTRLISLIDPDRTAYSFEHMQTLLKDVHDYLQLQNPTASYNDVSIYIPLFAQLKSVLFNDSDSAITASDLPNIAQLAIQLYGIWVRQERYLTSDSLYHAKTVDKLRSLLLNAMGVLKDACARRADKTIPIGDIDKILDQVVVLHFLPPVFDGPTVDAFAGRLIDYILNPQNIHPHSGLSINKMNYVEQEVNSWADVQDALVDGQAVAEPAWLEMRDVLSGPWPLRTDAEGRVIFDGKTNVPVNIASATRLNWSRELFHVLFNAYVLDNTRRLITNEMSQSELHQAYVDLKPALVAFGLDDVSDTTFDQRLYRDAHLFMPRSDGSQYLTFDEGVEYVQYVITGIDAADVLFAAAPAEVTRIGVKNCNTSDGRFNETCFRDLMENDANTLLSYMPGFRDYSLGLSVTGWQNNLTNIEKVVRANGPSSNPMTHADVDESFILLQYIETLMLRFDTDHDGIISPVEAIKMLKLFGPTIANALHLDPNQNQQQIEDMFTYILRYKELPNPNDPVAQLRFENWRLQRGHWEFGIDRGGLLTIIAYLSSLNI